MGVERMTCCGNLTRVYGDAGRRRHEKGCDGKPRERSWLLVLLGIERRRTWRSGG